MASDSGKNNSVSNTLDTMQSVIESHVNVTQSINALDLLQHSLLIKKQESGNPQPDESTVMGRVTEYFRKMKGESKSNIYMSPEISEASDNLVGSMQSATLLAGGNPNYINHMDWASFMVSCKFRNSMSFREHLLASIALRPVTEHSIVQDIYKPLGQICSAAHYGPELLGTLGKPLMDMLPNSDKKKSPDIGQ